MTGDAAGKALERASKDGVKFVDLWFTDFFGHVKSTSITVERLPESLPWGSIRAASSIRKSSLPRGR